MKTRIRQFKAANRPASKRNIILVACNLILVTGAICAAIIYSQIIMEQKNELRKDAFCTTVESMKQVSENYLYTEKGYVDEWAAYISSQHMTAEQALDFINATNTHADRQAHLVNLDDLSAHSSGMTDDNIWVHCYEDMTKLNTRDTNAFLEKMCKLPDVDSNEVLVLGKYRVGGESQRTVIRKNWR